MLEYGSLPYYEYESDQKVIKYVQGGNKVSKPTNCPSELYELMKACWEDEVFVNYFILLIKITSKKELISQIFKKK